MPRDLTGSARREGQPRHTIAITPDDPLEATASFLSVLAYPNLGNAEEDLRRQRFYRALRAYEIRERCHEDPDYAWTPQLIRPGLLTLSPKLVSRRVDEGLNRILAWRVAAAEIVAWRLLGMIEPEGLTGEALERAMKCYRENRRKTSVNKLTAMVAARTGADAKDVMHRHWSSSKPVLHLAWAVRARIPSRSKAPKLSPRWYLRQRFDVETLARCETRRKMFIALGIVRSEDTVQVVSKPELV